MQELTYKNIKFGLNVAESQYILKSFEPNKGSTDVKTVKIIGENGKRVTDSTYNAREVTAKGVIVAHSVNELAELRRRLCVACDGKTEDFLYYDIGDAHYKTPAIAEIPTFGGIKGLTLEFSLSFKMYRFFWYNATEKITPIYKIIPHVSTPFTLPMVLSSRIDGNTLSNSGDVPTPFILSIFVNGLAPTAGGIHIRNATTGEILKINYIASVGETIVIDTEEMTATSDKNGNVIRYIDRTSNFFNIPVGESEIKTINTDTDTAIIANVSYYERYIGV